MSFIVNPAGQITAVPVPVPQGGTSAATLSGILKGNGTSAVTTAASGTDYAPPTSGTSILKGSGAGGFSNATSGTDYAPATSGTSILKGSGAGGFSNAASGTDYAPATTGTSAQLLGSNGAGAFTNVTVGSGLSYAAGTLSASANVSSITFGTTGLTPSTPSNGAITVAGTLNPANGGTGLTTLTANNVILGNGTSTPLFVAPGTSGNVLQSNGTTWTSAAISTGGLTLLATLSPSGVTSISATSLTSSKAMLIVVDLSENLSGFALAELSVNNGSSYSATQHPLSATNSNSGQRGNAWISNMNINAKKISGSLGQSSAAGVFCQQNALAEGDATVNAGTVNAIRFKNSGGTTMNGTIYIYGLT